jgi:formate--tetrahydrofolate ligase
VPVEKTNEPNLQALAKGIQNLEKQLQNLHSFGLPVVVALNEFPADTREEIQYVIERCSELGADVAISQVWAKGGLGGEDLALKVVQAAEKPNGFRFLYHTNQKIKEKIETICSQIYGASGVDYSPQANQQIARFEDQGYGDLPVCIAKTQYSLSDNPNLKGRPEGFRVNIREVRLSAGAGFVVAIAGDIMTMPGLGKNPAAEKIDILPDGKIIGLF